MEAPANADDYVASLKEVDSKDEVNKHPADTEGRRRGGYDDDDDDDEEDDDDDDEEEEEEDEGEDKDEEADEDEDEDDELKFLQLRIDRESYGLSLAIDADSASISRNFDWGESSRGDFFQHFQVLSLLILLNNESMQEAYFEIAEYKFTEVHFNFKDEELLEDASNLLPAEGLDEMMVSLGSSLGLNPVLDFLAFDKCTEETLPFLYSIIGHCQQIKGLRITMAERLCNSKRVKKQLKKLESAITAHPCLTNVSFCNICVKLFRLACRVFKSMPQLASCALSGHPVEPLRIKRQDDAVVLQDLFFMPSKASVELKYLVFETTQTVGVVSQGLRRSPLQSLKMASFSVYVDDSAGELVEAVMQSKVSEFTCYPSLDIHLLDALVQGQSRHIETLTLSEDDENGRSADAFLDSHVLVSFLRNAHNCKFRRLNLSVDAWDEEFDAAICGYIKNNCSLRTLGFRFAHRYTYRVPNIPSAAFREACCSGSRCLEEICCLDDNLPMESWAEVLEPILAMNRQRNLRGPMLERISSTLTHRAGQLQLGQALEGIECAVAFEFFRCNWWGVQGLIQQFGREDVADERRGRKRPAEVLTRKGL